MLVYVIGAAVIAAIILVVKSLLQRRSEKSVADVLEPDFQKKKKQSEKKVQEYKDGKASFSVRYDEYLKSKRKSDDDDPPPAA